MVAFFNLSYLKIRWLKLKKIKGEKIMKYIKSTTVFNILKRNQGKKLALCFRINDVVIYNNSHKFYFF